MKKSEAIKALHEFLKTYENCTMNKEAAEEILDKVVKMGLKPMAYYINDGDLGGKWATGWEPENEEK